MADLDSEGRPDPRSLYRSGATYSGELKSLGKGTAVQWSKSMCSTCNGCRDQSMDRAYEVYSNYVWEHQKELAKARHLDWALLFGDQWQTQARDVARYYAKHVGCLFAQQSLRPPDSLVAFLDGAEVAEHFCFAIVRDRGRRVGHRIAARRGLDMRGYWMPPSTATLTPDGTSVATFSHQPYIGFVGVNIDFATGLNYPSFFESALAPIITVTGVPPWKLRLKMARGRASGLVSRRSGGVA